MSIPDVDVDYLLHFLTQLLNTPSPTGFADKAVSCVEETLAVFPELNLARNRKGALLAELPGESAIRSARAHCPCRYVWARW